MWNKGFHIIWIKIHIDINRPLHLNIPVSLYAFEELLYGILDLLKLPCIICSSKSHSLSSSSLSIITIRDLIHELLTLFHTITASGPYDFIEVETGNINVSIKIK